MWLVILDAVIWAGFAYLMFVGSSTVFGRVLGSGVLAPLLVVVISVIAIPTALRGLGGVLARGFNGVTSRSSALARVLMLLLVGAMTASLVIWGAYAIAAGVHSLAKGSSLAAAAVCVLVAYCVLIVALRMRDISASGACCADGGSEQ